MLPTAKLRRRKRPSGSIGWSVRASQTMKPANMRGADREREEDGRVAPAAQRLLDQPEGHPREAERAQRRPHHVDARVRVALATFGHRAEDDEERDAGRSGR